MTDATPVEDGPPIEEGPPVEGEAPSSRRHAVLQALLVGTYLFVVFGVLLPSIVDYGAMVDAFRAAPPAWLAVVAVVGVGTWLMEGLAIRALMPGLGVVHSVVAWLSMTAIGNTIPGPWKLGVGYKMYRDWGISPAMSALSLTLNSLATQVGKLLLPAVAIAFLTIQGTIPSYGWLIALLVTLPVALGSLVGIWVLRSEAFAERVGAMATRATRAAARRIHRDDPGDLTGRLLDFRASAKALLVDRAVPTVVTQVATRATGYLCLLLSLRAVGVTAEMIPADVVLLVYAVVMLITLIPIAPGGAGLPELLYITLFTRYVGDPALNDMIAAGVMLYRGFTWFLPIPVGYIVLMLHRRSVRGAASAGGEPVAGTA
jgi:putative heme transporter